VSEVASAATPPSGAYEVELRVTGATDDAPLLSGLIVEATIEPTATVEVAMIPAAALRDGDGRRASVWVPRGDGRAERRSVEIAFLDGAQLAVASGLDGATAVITDGAAYLTPESAIVASAEVQP